MTLQPFEREDLSMQAAAAIDDLLLQRKTRIFHGIEQGEVNSFIIRLLGVKARSLWQLLI